MTARTQFRVPRYRDGCIGNVMPTIFRSLAKSCDGEGFPNQSRLDQTLSRGLRLSSNLAPDLVPGVLSSSEQVVLLVLDGLGYRQLVSRLSSLRSFAMMDLLSIDSVAPTTTAAALPSLTTGLSPAEHGVVGYRIRVGPGVILNTLKWTVAGDSSGRAPDPRSIQPHEPFLGLRPVVVTKSLFENTGFTKAHLRGVRSSYYRTMSGLVSRVQESLRTGERFIYLYYEGIDTTAHEFGLGEAYDTELQFVDFLLGHLMAVLPKRSSLIVTADHGQVEVKSPPLHLSGEILSDVHYQSGEGRFRWLHVRGGRVAHVKERCVDLYGGDAEILTRAEVLDCQLFGPGLSDEAARRLGDVALIARSPVAFFDPADTGPFELVARHGGLTDDE
ncbi:MAG: alkaline phosphatase family protein, partial [Acidimicrobiales bacterium]